MHWYRRLSHGQTAIVLRPFVRDYPDERVPEETFTHPASWSSPNLCQLLPSTMRSTASSLFKLRAWQSFCTTSLHVLLCLPLGLEPSASYSIRLFTQSVSSFRNTCPYHRNLFCCSINIISFIPSLSLNSVFHLNVTHPSDHSHLCSLAKVNSRSRSIFAVARPSVVCLSVCLQRSCALLRRL